ncbi:Gfo/Idh/MocA family oxidoreductase [Candidatus Poribacteria bacterium]|nr:Gfo/Idh/MocA family oxidoreductase [Candidatus Poribacteria bacterium]
MAKLGVAVHGAGWVSGEHIKAYLRNPYTEIRVISSRREASARARAEECELACDICTDFDEVLKRDDIDIISICTPNHLHPSETMAAAEAGKNILIEKPVAMNLKDLKEMRDAVRKAKVKTVVSFVLHWNPFFQTVKSLIDDGTLGKIFFAETDYFHEIGKWYSGYEWSRTKEMGGSAMLFGGCHAIDAIRWFVGSEVIEVTAYSTRGHRQDFEYEPSVVAILKFANGAIGKVGCSFEIDMPYVFNVFVHGTKGSVRNEKLYCLSKFPGQKGFITIPTIMPDSGDVSHHPFQGEIDHLVDCILKNEESHVNLDDAIKTHEVALAIDMSAEQGGKPIKLPLIED